MKQLILSLILLAGLAPVSSAQAPGRFNYQGIARNGKSEPIASKPLGLRFTILRGAPGGAIVFQETQTTNTNEFGLYNVSVGGGTPVVGTLADVPWDSAEMYIRVEIDIAGGTAYTDLGARQLVSVPYALYAASAPPPTLSITGNTISAGGNSITIPGASGNTDYIAKFSSPNTLGNSLILDNGTSVGIGLTPLSAANKFQVVGLGATAIAGSTTGPASSGVQGGTSAAGAGVSGVVTGAGTGAAGLFDGGTAGRGILVPRGSVGINDNAPQNRLSVIGGTSATGIDTNAAIYGIAGTVKAAVKGGVMGSYDPVLNDGVGVQGIGRNGYSLKLAQDSFLYLGLPSSRHLGLYGNAQDLGVLGIGTGSYGMVGISKAGTGVFGHAQGAAGNGVSGLGWTTGVRGTNGYTPGAGITAPPVPATGYGVIGTAGNGLTRYGVYGAATPANAIQSIGVGGFATSTVVTTGVNYGVFGTASNGATNWAGYFAGSVNVTGTLAKGAGTFKIDHPLDPENKYLYHSFVESPDMMNIYNGNITTDAAGFARVTMPEYFDALNKDFRYQLTVIGTFAQAIVKEEMKGNVFVIQTSEPRVKVSWQVTGVRDDKFANAHRVEAEVEKDAKDKGKYIHPAEWGKPASAGIDYEIIHQTPPAE